MEAKYLSDPVFSEAQTMTCKHCVGSGRLPLGSGIRKAREAAGLTQNEVGHRLGVTNQYLSFLERNERNLSWYRYKHILKIIEQMSGEKAHVPA